MGHYPMSILLQEKKSEEKKTLHLEAPQAKQTKLRCWPGQSLGTSWVFSLPPFPLLCFPWLLPTPHRAAASAPLTFRPSGPFSPGGPMSPGKPWRKRGTVRVCKGGILQAVSASVRGLVRSSGTRCVTCWQCPGEGHHSCGREWDTKEQHQQFDGRAAFP